MPEIDSLLIVTDSIVIGFGESDSTLWMPIQVSYTPAGNIAVLDRYKHHINIYTTEGEYVHTVGGEGEGPGRLRLPNAFDFFPDGRLLIADANHISCFDQDHAFMDRMDIIGSIPINVVVVGESSFVLEKNVPEVNDGEPAFCYVIYRMDWGSTEATAEYCRVSMPLGMPGNYLDKSKIGDLQHCVARNGRVFYSEYSTEEFIFDGFEPSGDHYLHFEDESFTRVRKSESEIQREIDSDNEYFSYVAGRNISMDIRPDPFKVAISDMFVDEDDRLWIALGAFDGNIFSVYDMSGNHTMNVMISDSFDMSPFNWVLSPERNGRFLIFNQMAEDSFKIYQMELIANPE
ncbi:MAG: hypothetical protein KAR44_09530 [Candidatus Aegiribacteria sp.]|nr:hypothetical protein [Candidatus Aegiribacteria sp.]